MVTAPTEPTLDADRLREAWEADAAITRATTNDDVHANGPAATDRLLYAVRRVNVPQLLATLATTTDERDLWRAEWEGITATAHELAATLATERAEGERLRREWPVRNQVEGLGRSVEALYHLRDLLALTCAGLRPDCPPGTEANYGDVLRFHLEAIERMIEPDYDTARRKWDAALSARPSPTEEA